MILFDEHTAGGIARMHLSDAKTCLCNADYTQSVKYCAEALKFIFKEFINAKDAEYFLGTRRFYTESLKDLGSIVEKYTYVGLPESNVVSIVYIDKLSRSEVSLRDDEEALLIYEYTNRVFKHLTKLLVAVELEKGDMKRG